MSDAKENIDMADMDGIRDRILALQRSASNMVQMDLEELSALLPPETSREKLMEIRSKLIQLHALQNGRENAQENEAPNLIAEGVANRSSRYKTELCRPYEENGVCKYGARCQFAHGVAELRNMTRHPKYKSQLCRTFHSNGLCPYGHRCHFIHNEDEARRVVPPKPLGAQANPVLADANANNVLNSRPLPQPLVHEWSRRGGPSNFPNGTYGQAPVSYVVPSLQPANVMQVSSAVPVVNNFNSLTNGRSLGSAGDLSPPVSPIIYSPDDPFSNQIPIRPGYFPSGTSGENSELNLNQMAASARSSVPIVGSWPQANFHTVRRSLRHPSQALPSSVWLNNQEL